MAQSISPIPSHMRWGYDVGPMQEARLGNRAVSWGTSRVIVIGGSTQSRNTEVVDTVTGESEILHELPIIPWPGIGVVPDHANGVIHLIGSHGGLENVPLGNRVHKERDSVDERAHSIYDPETGHLEQIAELVVPRSRPATVMFDGRIYAFGGMAPHPDLTAGEPTDRVEIYDFSSGTWSEIGLMPLEEMMGGTDWTSDSNPVIGIQGQGIAAHNGAIHLLGGTFKFGFQGHPGGTPNGPYGTTDQHFRFDPETEGYSVLARTAPAAPWSITTMAPRYPGLATLNGRLWTYGGRFNPPTTSTTYSPQGYALRYDEEADVWQGPDTYLDYDPDYYDFSRGDGAFISHQGRLYNFGGTGDVSGSSGAQAGVQVLQRPVEESSEPIRRDISGRHRSLRTRVHQ